MSRRRLLIAPSSGGGEEPPILLSWEHVLWSIENNRYKTDYSIGDLIPLDLGAFGQLNAQIADFDHDDLADGTGKAHISFITKELCYGSGKMNSTRTNVGGWKDSWMRNAVMPDVWEKLPTILQESIVEVVKKTSAGNKDTTIVAANDKLWIPSLCEVDSLQTDSIYLDEGATYPVFTDSSDRIKIMAGTESAYTWWLRSPKLSSTTTFYYVTQSGSTTSAAADDRRGVVVCFCT